MWAATIAPCRNGWQTRVRATVRLTGVAKNTIVKLLVELGAACTKYQDETLRNLPCRRLQVDEIWSFVGAKDRNIPAEKRGEWGIGSVWTYTAIDADTKLVPHGWSSAVTPARRTISCRIWPTGCGDACN